MSAKDSQLKAIEERLFRIEQKLGLAKVDPPETAPIQLPPTVEPSVESSCVVESRTMPPSGIVEPEIVMAEVAAPALAPWSAPARVSPRVNESSSAFATTVMAVGAAISFLLAAGYFLALVYSSGLLTPPLQIAIASIAGIGFIVGGLLFSQRERQYSAYLPAVGVAILFLASMAAHSMYDLISFPVMMVAVGVISLVTIAIDRYFNQAIYSVIAAVMVYATPLLSGGDANLYTTVVYYTAWALLFSYMSLQLGRRLIYLIAMYMAVLSFDASWRFSGQQDWQVAFMFQFVQFLVFAGTAAAYSFVHKKGVTEGEATAHSLPLFFYYFSQVVLLKMHFPNAVEVFGLVCVGMVVGLYFFGRDRLDKKGSSNATALVSLFASVVIAHVVFVELLPISLLPWSVLAVPVIVLAVRTQTKLSQAAMVPILLVTSVLMTSGLVLAFAPEGLLNEPVPAARFVLFSYAAILYACYWFFVNDTRVTNLSPGILYAGHVAFLIGVVRLTDNQLFVSLIWAGLAVALLVFAIKSSDRILGQSSLLIFIASAIKVVMFDLAGSPGPIRVGILVILGASLYAGGWLYQNLVRKTQVFHSNKVINEQIRAINTLVQQGLTTPQIHQKLTKDKVDCLAEGGWTVELIQRIQNEYLLA
jgi:uncharacterized membrane protein